MSNQLINTKRAKLVRLDPKIHIEAKTFASSQGRTLQSLTEELWLDLLTKDQPNE